MLQRFAVAVVLATVCSLSAACKKSEAQSMVERKQQFQAQQRKKAVENYQQILKKYPDSEFAAKAQERLRAMNAQAPGAGTK